MKKTLLILILCPALLFSGCSSQETEECGDDVCQTIEKRTGSCPIDCVSGSSLVPFSTERPTATEEGRAESKRPLAERPTPNPPKKSSKTTETKKTTAKPKEKPPAFEVERIYTLKDYGQGVDWHKKDFILTSKIDSDGYLDIMRFNSEGYEEECLTCDRHLLLAKNVTNPSWYPNGKYIVFTAEKEEVPEYPSYDRQSIPGQGFNHDIYVMKLDGSDIWKVYEMKFSLKEPIGAVISPHFSPNGKKLMWAERFGPGESPSLGLGEWAIRIADFKISKGAAKLGDIVTLQLGDQEQFYNTHAFSKEARNIIFSGNLEQGQRMTGMDIYKYNFSKEDLVRLTETPAIDEWDGSGLWSPNQKKIAWASSQGYDIKHHSQSAWRQYLQTELWVMKMDGSEKTQLTHFNTPGYPEYKGGSRVIITDLAWSPDSEKVLLSLAWEVEGRKMSELVMVGLEEEW